MAEQPDDRHGYDGATVATYAALAFVLAWCALAVLLLQTNRGVHAWYVTGGLAVIAAALLVPRRTRRAGGSALLGLAIGAILGSGACAATVGTGPVIG